MHTLPNNFYNPLPTAHQTLLLKACLLDNDKAVPYWEKWMLVNGFSNLTSQPSSGILPQVYDRLDFASQRLLALLYKKMSSAGVKACNASQPQSTTAEPGARTDERPSPATAHPVRRAPLPGRFAFTALRRSTRHSTRP